MTVACPETINLAQYCLAKSAAATSEKIALLVTRDAVTGAPSETWTYAALEDAVLRLAGALTDLGFAPGERVLIRLENTSTFPILYFACMAAGLIAVPASSQLTAGEADFLLRDSGARLVALAAHLPKSVIALPIRQTS